MSANGETAALVKVEPKPEYEGLVMVVSPLEAQRRVQELQAFVKSVMVPGIDYGTIPGTDKPTLYQPGAQKLEELYGLAHQFEDTATVQEWDRPFFLFRKRCVITSRRDGRYIGDGIGSCNSREDRYAWRWLWDKPAGVPDEQMATRKTRNGKTQWRVPNPDIYSLVNTLEKMACKRALVHAIIGVTRSSGLFTQDVEDLPKEVFGAPEEHRSWEDASEANAEMDRAVDRALERIAAATSYKDLRAIHAEAQKAKLGTERLARIVQACSDRNGALNAAADAAKKAAKSNPTPLAEIIPGDEDA